MKSLKIHMFQVVFVFTQPVVDLLAYYRISLVKSRKYVRITFIAAKFL